MFELVIWAEVLATVSIALVANSVSAIWAEQDKKLTWWLVAVVLISPLVYITFGLMTAKIGVAIGSGTLDSLLSISTIAVGLVFFKDSKKLSRYQFLGLYCIVVGIICMQLSR